MSEIIFAIDLSTSTQVLDYDDEMFKLDSGWNDFLWTIQPAHSYDAVASDEPAWFVGTYQPATTNLIYRTLTWDEEGEPSLSSVDTITIGPEGTDELSSGGFEEAPHVGASPSDYVDTYADDDGNGGYLHNASIRNSTLWTVRSFGDDTYEDQMGVEWIKLTVNPANETMSIAADGRIADPATSDPFWYYYPTIVGNGQGHVLTGYSGSSDNDYIGGYFSSGDSGDLANSLATVNTLKNGEVSYDPGAITRWGDYSHSTLDPVNDMAFWSIQEYAKEGAGLEYVVRNWGTWIGEILPSAVTLDEDTIQVTGSLPKDDYEITLTGSGFCDPGSNFSERLKVAIVGGNPNGITIDGDITVVDSTEITFDIDVSASASSGYRDIIVINSDGQIAVLEDGLDIP